MHRAAAENDALVPIGMQEGRSGASLQQSTNTWTAVRNARPQHDSLTGDCL
jgi:hypothetical protein